MLLPTPFLDCPKVQRNSGHAPFLSTRPIMQSNSTISNIVMKMGAKLGKW